MKYGRRVFFLFRRASRTLAGLLVSVSACAAVALGALPNLAEGESTALGVAATAVLCAVVVGAVATRLRFEAPSARLMRASRLARWAPAVVDMELGLALVAGTYGLVALTGGAHSPLQPAVYFLAAFAATFLSRAGAVVVVAGCAALEAATTARWGVAWPVAVQHMGFLVAAALLHGLFLRGLVAFLRTDHDRRLAEEAKTRRDEAREFRLIAAALGAESRASRPREEEEGKLAEGAVEQIHASMYYTLELLKQSIDLTTCVLLWLDQRGAQLRIKELVTDSDCVVETPLSADAGVLGAIVRDRILLNLSQPKRGHVPYYVGPEEVGAFLGVPVLEDGHLRGVLCADRRTGAAFSARDEALLVGAAQQILRAIQSERIFAAVERSKYEHERFYHASARLVRALTPEEVMDTAIEAAREIVPFDMAAIALFDRETRRHRVCRVHVADGAKDLVKAEALDGLEYRDNAGLASMVVKNKHYLPAGGELRDQATPVFTKRIKLKNAESLLVLPLICADDAVGTFTLASRRPHAFGKDAREMLGVIANQVAVSLENAKMYRQMERMATTDGLTGLLNHRSFQERLSDLLDRAERHGTELSLILTDIDHFKKVNDTYGHPVGDEVLRRVARVLEKSVRKIDIVARYGGEEFAIVMDGADAAGAQQLAERIRQEVGDQIIQSDQGPFRCTLSLGIASYPRSAADKKTLIERTDQALYHAKHNGRNRSVTYEQFQAERAARKAG